MQGEAKSILWNPDNVGGLPLTDGPSGIRSDAPDPEGRVAYTDGGPIDRLAMLAANDIAEYWESNYSPALEGTFVPVENFASWDSRDPNSPKMCGSDGYQNPNAFFCYPLDLMAWDRGQLFPIGKKYFGEVSVAAVMGHEYGHAVQDMADIVDRSDPTVIGEQQADCFEGAYIRWVAEGKSPRFELNTGEGLTKVLGSLVGVRDPVWSEEDQEMVTEGHGTALDRVTAFQMGFVEGVSACARIDLEEIETRRGDLPILLGTDDSGAEQTGEATINQQFVDTLIEQLNRQFTPKNPPTVSTQPAAQPCPDAKPTLIASYCPATNTITVDMPAMQKFGAVADIEQGVLVQGDNTSISVLVSRYMLALQHERNVSLTDAAASLRTACLTGYAQRNMVEVEPLPSGSSITITAGDMDEAVAGLLNNGLVASDVDGETVPAGFSRVMAFRAGLLDTDADACYTRFP
jgi:predicted metalloprotease